MNLTSRSVWNCRNSIREIFECGKEEVAVLTTTRPDPHTPLTNKSSTFQVTVVPFAVMTPGEEQRLFAAELTQDLTTTLTRCRWLGIRVGAKISGASVTTQNIKLFGQELDFNYVVHRNTGDNGEQVRITAQVIGAMTGRYLWVMRYDCPTQNLLDRQDELAKTSVPQLKPSLSGAPKMKLVIWFLWR